MKHQTRSLTLLVVSLAAISGARAQVIYDPTLGSNPAGQGWNSSLVGATETLTSAGVRLNTLGANSVQAGYSWTNTPLNRGFGFLVQADLQLLTEVHVRPDRAGLSWIVLSSDKRGVELSFWSDRVFALSTAFTRAEQGLIDTTVARRWTLAFTGNTYNLSASGTTVLTGNLRDYSAFGPPYNTSNFIFMGDNTTSARGEFVLGRVAVLSPEPGSIGLLATGLALGAVALRRRRRR